MISILGGGTDKLTLRSIMHGSSGLLESECMKALMMTSLYLSLSFKEVVGGIVVALTGIMTSSYLSLHSMQDLGHRAVV